MSSPARKLVDLSGVLALGWLPLLLLLDLGLAMGRGWIPLRREEGQINLGLIAVLGILLLAGAVGPWRRRLFTLRGELLLASLGLGLGLVLAELGVRRVVPQDPFHLRPPNLDLRLRVQPGVLPGVFQESRFSTNSLGLRGDPWPLPGKAYRILCLGGSTTECFYLDDSETWPRLLQDRLAGSQPRPVWVGNAGASGYGLPHHLAFLDQSALVPQMDALVVMVGINDLAWFLSGGESEILEHLANDQLGPQLLHSGVYRLLSQGLGGKGLIPWYLDPVVQSGQNYAILRSHRARSPRTTRLPELSDFLARYERRLERLASTARSLGLRLLLVDQPVIWRPDLPPEIEARLWFPHLADGSYPTPATGRAAMERVNLSTRRVAARVGVSHVDWSQLSGQETLFYDDCHFSEAGAREVSRRVAESFLKL